jgi:hypothetical protein
VKQTWWSRRAVGLHVVILVVVPTFAALCLWQLHRALNGNGLSWAYVFEWPFFAGYAIYMWWRFVHEPPRTAPDAPTLHAGASHAAAGDALLGNAVAGSAGASDAASGGAASSVVAVGAEPLAHVGAGQATPKADAADPDAAERNAYNEYLSALATRGKRKQWR